MQEDGFAWWIARMQRQFELFDLVRIDHFRGLVGGLDDRGQLRDGRRRLLGGNPGRCPARGAGRQIPPACRSSQRTLVSLPKRSGSCVASMGSPECRCCSLRSITSMTTRISRPTSRPTAVVYTGTHDNDTCLGWFRRPGAHEKDFVFQVLGRATDRGHHPPHDRDRHAKRGQPRDRAPAGFSRPGQRGTHEHSRASAEGNWGWRFGWDMLPTTGCTDPKSRVAASGRLHEH